MILANFFILHREGKNLSVDAGETMGSCAGEMLRDFLSV